MDADRHDSPHAVEPAADEQIATVQERIDERREHLAGTIEALSYKTDVKARGSEALAEGVDTAKHVAAQAAENAAVQAIDVTARASDAVSDGIAIAKKQTALAADFAVATAESVEPETWVKFRWGAAAAVLVVLAAVFLRRRST